MEKHTVRRVSIFSFFAMFGGFLSLCRVLSNFFAKDFQTFSLENSMIKKLYSAKELKVDDVRFEELEPDEQLKEDL